MAAEVETMFSVRERPWHGLGVILDDAPPTWQEAYKMAGLDWGVKKQDVFRYHEVALDDTMMYEQLVNYSTIIRSDNNESLGIVGAGYQPVQNAEMFQFFDEYIKTGLVEYNTAGSLKDGRIVWVLAKMIYGSTRIVGDDVVDHYLLLSNSHDGTRRVSISMTPIRVVCWNTLNMSDASHAARITFKHTKGVIARTQDTMDILANLSFEFEKTADLYRALAAKNVKSQASLNEFLMELFPGDGVRRTNQRENVMELFETGAGADLPGVRDTWWGAYNAVTEYIDHDRGTDAEKRLISTWFGQGASIKATALALATGM